MSLYRMSIVSKQLIHGVTTQPRANRASHAQTTEPFDEDLFDRVGWEKRRPVNLPNIPGPAALRKASCRLKGRNVRRLWLKTIG